MASVSFIIPSYNSYLTIEKTILSIFSQKALGHIKEVIVVDSSDDAKTRDVLKDFNHAQLKIIERDGKTPPAAGRNIGGKSACGELVCFIDSDVFLADDWLDHILTIYSNGCKLGAGSVSIPPWQADNAIALAQLYLQFNETLGVGEARIVKMVPSCNMFCERELFLHVGGFPSLRASEDTMFCLGLTGVAKIWFVPSARAFHIFREEWKGFQRNQILLGQYVGIYRRMYYKSWIYKGCVPVILFPGFLLIKLIRMTIRIHKAGDDHFRKFLKSLIIFMSGIFYWSYGFIKGCFTKI